MLLDATWIPTRYFRLLGGGTDVGSIDSMIIWCYFNECFRSSSMRIPLSLAVLIRTPLIHHMRIRIAPGPTPQDQHEL